MIVDLTLLHRLETATAQRFERAVRELAPAINNHGALLRPARKGVGCMQTFERA